MTFNSTTSRCVNCFHGNQPTPCSQSEGTDYCCIDWREITTDEKRVQKILQDITTEIAKASQEHGTTFASNHEGYAVILEELDELWDEIKKKKSIQDHDLMRSEAIQVAAMAIKFIWSMEKRDV